MRSMIVFLCIILFAVSAFATTQPIVCGKEPGEIYFLGLHPLLHGLSGFYYSDDYGENIEMRSINSPFGFGALLPDAADSIVYHIMGDIQFYTLDGGYHWILIDTSHFTRAYASGIISGEIYRRRNNSVFRLERSINYGFEYNLCTCTGGTDSLGIRTTALGPDSGEVYIWGDFGKLFYSDDYAENFTLLVDGYTTWGISPYTDLINGAEAGEIYIFNDPAKRVYRISNFGEDAEIILDLAPEYIFWGGSVATSRQPGELYFWLLREEMVPGGTMRILHTTNYFQTYTIYEHLVPEEGVNDPQITIVPSSINLNVWPNPTNAAFHISYHLHFAQSVDLAVHNILGQSVWQYHLASQWPGNYIITFACHELPSGKYFLQFVTKEATVFRSLMIVR